jgi:hypothetical protein
MMQWFAFNVKDLMQRHGLQRLQVYAAMSAMSGTLDGFIKKAKEENHGLCNMP